MHLQADEIDQYADFSFSFQLIILKYPLLVDEFGHFCLFWNQFEVFNDICFETFKLLALCNEFGLPYNPCCYVTPMSRLISIVLLSQMSQMRLFQVTNECEPKIEQSGYTLRKKYSL